MRTREACLSRAGLAAAWLVVACAAAAQPYDIVISGGRVIDPESGLDAVRDIGIRGGRIAAVAPGPLRGASIIDARGMVVSPGFIDLHVHGVDPENSRLQVMDGVTTALELEIGTADVDRWYEERRGSLLNHYGVSAGHVRARMKIMRDPSTSLMPTGDAARRAASAREIREIVAEIARGLDRGALGVGVGIQYTPAASREEIVEVFRAAARAHVPCYAHIRHAGVRPPDTGAAALEEVIAAAASTGAGLHVVHLPSMGLAAAPELMRMIAGARERGLDVTTECYPYTAGMTYIESATFDQDWRGEFGIGYGELQWATTGERLTEESFARYRKTGGLVALHTMPEDVVRDAVANPLTIIASDGILSNGKGHPRTAGTFARVLSKYVRESRALSLPDALRKMTLMPAQRLEARLPSMRNKGRIRPGADADIAVFDPARVIDRATYDQPARPSEGFRCVLVDGVPVVKDGRLQHAVGPGKPLRAISR